MFIPVLHHPLRPIVSSVIYFRNMPSLVPSTTIIPSLSYNPSEIMIPILSYLVSSVPIMYSSVMPYMSPKFISDVHSLRKFSSYFLSKILIIIVSYKKNGVPSMSPIISSLVIFNP